MDDQELSQPPDIQAQSNPQLNDLLTRMLAQSGGQTGTPQINPLAALQAPAQAEDSTPDPARDFIQQHVGETPQDILMRRLHMSPEERAKRGKWGNVGVQASNILLSLITGGNQRQFANEDYDRMTHRLQVASGEVRNQDLNTRAQAALEQAGKYKDLADKRAQDLLGIKQQLADTTQQTAETKAADLAQKNEIAKAKLDIARLAQEAKAGDMSAKQKLAERAMSLNEKYPHLGGVEAIISNALTENGQKPLDLDEFGRHVTDIYNAKKGPVIIKNNTPTFDGTGTQNGTQQSITAIPRAQLGGGGTITAQGPQFSTNPTDGSFNGTPAMGKAVAEQEKIRRAAGFTAQNLLQDLGTGQIDKYSGVIRGNKYVAAIRSQFGADDGGLSTGEAFEQQMSPTNVLGAIRSMSNRVNKTEIDAFTKAMGSQSQGGEALTRRALLFHLVQDDKLMRLHPGVGNPQITDKDGNKVNIEDTPEFMQEMRNAVDNAVNAAKKSKGTIPVKAPTIQDVLSATKARLADKSKDLQVQAASTIPGVSPAQIEKLKQELLGGAK